MKLTQLTSPWDHGLKMVYQAIQVDDLEDATIYNIKYLGREMIHGWFRVYRKEKLGFYIYLN